jgi:sugar phosphate isomerase/epimerase
MKLGLLTACLPGATLSAIVEWAAAHGFEALEVAVWPRSGSRPFEASHIDVETFDERASQSLRELLERHGLMISALAYYDNNLHPDEGVRAAIHEHLRRTIDAATLLECPLVGTFVGRDPTCTVSENVALAERLLPALVEYAGERGVRLMVENCPMEGWHPDGYPGNLAYSPELWQWMFSLGLYLNYDPSHLTWLGIDPIAAIQSCPEQIVHAHAKDVEIDVAGRNRVSALGRALDRSNPWDNGGYRYRAVGLGAIEWRRVVDTLYQVGFEGTLAVEHEDPVWSGDEERIKKGLRIALATLRPLVLP